MEVSLWERLTEGEMFSKSLIQFSVDGRYCVPSLLFDLRPNYGGGNEDNGDFLQKVPCMCCCTPCLRPCSRPPQTHASTGDSWTLMGMSGSVFRGVSAPFSWVLVCTRFLFVPSKSLFPQSYVAGGFMVGLTATSSKRAHGIPRSSTIEASRENHKIIQL